MDLPIHLSDYSNQIDQLRRLAEFCWQRNLSPAGSGSFSHVVERQPFRMLTIIGHQCRGHLQPTDFAIVDDEANPIPPTSAKLPQATALHIWLAQQYQASMIVQTYSLWSALLADRFGPLDGVLLEGSQLLQRLPDVDSSSHVEWLPIVLCCDQIPSTQAVQQTMQNSPTEIGRPPRAMVIQQCGMFTWADNSDNVQDQVELFEYFCEYLVRKAALG